MTQRRSEAHGDSNLYNFIVEVPQGLTPNEFSIFATLPEFQAAAGAKGRLEGGFESFKAVNCCQTKSQDEASLEARFKATRARLQAASAIETEKW